MAVLPTLHGGTPEIHVGLYTDLTSRGGDEGALNTDTPQNGHKRGPRRGRLMGSHPYSLCVERSRSVFPKMGLVRVAEALDGGIVVPGLATCSRTGKGKAITPRSYTGGKVAFNSLTLAVLAEGMCEELCIKCLIPIHPFSPVSVQLQLHPSCWSAMHNN